VGNELGTLLGIAEGKDVRNVEGIDDGNEVGILEG
jgi:hypothetical protein